MNNLLSSLMAFLHYPNEEAPETSEVNAAQLLQYAAKLESNSDRISQVSGSSTFEDSFQGESLIEVLKRMGLWENLETKKLDQEQQQVLIQKRKRRDKLAFCILMAIIFTGGYLFLSRPGPLFYQFFMFSFGLGFFQKIVDYSQKKSQLFLIDWCPNACVQISIYLNFFGDSADLAQCCFAYGAGILGCSAVIFQNSLTPWRMDHLSSVWYHLPPSFVAYCLRYMDASSPIYYQTYQPSFSLVHMGAFYRNCLIPYLLWSLSYYLLITRVFRRRIVEGDYETLPKFVAAEMPWTEAFFDIFGTARRNEAFMVCHLSVFLITTTMGMISFHSQTFALITLGLFFGSCLWKGAGNLVDSLSVTSS